MLMPHSADVLTNPTAAQAANLIEASRKPAAQLADYIAGAAQRDPIPCEPAGKRIEEILASSSRNRRGEESNSQIQNRQRPLASAEASGTRKPLIITNGWLTCDSRLVCGGSTGVVWWRGNIRPSEA